jgi:hypothetical protein
MVEQAHSSTEIGESGDKTNIQGMFLKLIERMDAQFQETKREFQDIRKDREQDRVGNKQEFQEMREQSFFYFRKPNF